MSEQAQADRRVLARVFAINGAQAGIGLVVGWWASSTAVMGTALDNLSDAAIYALARIAAGRSHRAKANVARLSGWLLIAFAGGLVFEVLRRFFVGAEPLGVAMMAMAAVNGVLALISMRLLARHRGDGAHVTAAKIFTANDMLANLGTLVSGVLVLSLSSPIPDLIVGLAVAAVAVHGGRKILAAGRAEEPRRHAAEAPA